MAFEVAASAAIEKKLTCVFDRGLLNNNEQ